MSSGCQTLTVEEEEMRPHLFVGDIRLVAAEWAADYGRRRLSWNHMIQQVMSPGNGHAGICVIQQLTS